MRIKKLEIHGFKSFAERAVLHFGHGITGVVGPNGCGKSNIVDALRWCMGEMSAKHLRGRAMQDVIFAGSDSRGPLGMAEVTLTFDNDGNVPPEYAQFSEIAVTRRLHRDGSSEYLVNKVPARLRDITDLFLGTGVGTRAYSIIEQGRIGFIVSSKPEDRRSLIEEVAGITKFKARKKAAERRMESTQQNLSRVGDIVTELERQLQSLRRQAKRAEKYKELRSELRDLELHHASLETLRVLVMKKLASSHSEALEQEAQEAQAGIAAHEISIEEDRLRLLAIERALQHDQAASAELETKLAALERDLEHWRRQRDEANARGQAARRDLEDAENKLTTARAEHEGHTVNLSNLATSVDVDRERLLSLDADHGETQGKMTSIDRRAESLRRSAVEYIHEGARQRTLVAAIAKRTHELRSRLEHSTAELEDVAHRRGVAEIKARALTEQRDALMSQMTDWRSWLDTNRITLDAAVTAMTESDRLVRSLRDELSERRSRLESLQEIARHFEGYSDGVRSLMQPAIEGMPGRTAVSGVRALITDVLEVPPQLEIAVEAALGERLQYVVVDAQTVGVTAIAYLRSIAGGRSGFVPVEPRNTGGVANGDALTRVQARPGFEAVAEYLLRDVSIVANLDEAML
ncbi:MAG: AAA family ATPase, partial [Clostridia bacterium]|nr:AAA family ATPase [Deltaproteobacteria bacterium]